MTWFARAQISLAQAASRAFGSSGVVRVAAAVGLDWALLHAAAARTAEKSLRLTFGEGHFHALRFDGGRGKGPVT